MKFVIRDQKQVEEQPVELWLEAEGSNVKLMASVNGLQATVCVVNEGLRGARLLLPTSDDNPVNLKLLGFALNADGEVETL